MFKKKYWLVIAIFLLMQLLTAVIPTILYLNFGFDFISTAVYTNITLFIMAVIAIVWIMWRDVRDESLAYPMPPGKIIGWIALGLLLAWIANALTVSILLYGFGVDGNSANTEAIVEISRMNPFFIIIPAIAGPIMEELIFRKIIFGYFNKKFNFAVAAIVSSLLFGLAHMEFTLLLVYVAMGFVFAFIYWKTKRIIIPILVHVSLNSIAVIGQLLIDPEKLEQMQDELMLILNIH